MQYYSVALRHLPAAESPYSCYQAISRVGPSQLSPLSTSAFGNYENYRDEQSAFRSALTTSSKMIALRSTIPVVAARPSASQNQTPLASSPW